MYYPCRENKGADQLRGYREADLRLCFRLCRLLVFPWGGSNSWTSSRHDRHFCLLEPTQNWRWHTYNWGHGHVIWPELCLQKCELLNLLCSFTIGWFVKWHCRTLHKITREEKTFFIRFDLTIAVQTLTKGGSLASFLWDKCKQYSPRCDAAERASHLGLFCLLNDNSFEKWNTN